MLLFLKKLEVKMKPITFRKFLLLMFVLFILCYSSLFASQLSIYCEDDPPFQIIEKDGSLKGLTAEVCQEIQKRVGNKDKIEVVPWARGLNALDTKPNTVLFSMSRTPERNPLYQWVGPVNEISYGLYVKAESKISIKNLDEAKKLKSIGVYNNDIRDQYLTRQGFTNLDRVTDNTTNIKKLMLGRIDAYADSDDGLKSNAKEAGYTANDLKLIHVFMKTQLYIAMSKDTPHEIVKQWNDALEQMKKDGTFKKIYTKYFPGKALPGPAINKF
jgi:polar amino acid transport system substrate-binding protein